jgi:CRP-like cAMP-binding protein
VAGQGNREPANRSVIPASGAAVTLQPPPARPALQAERSGVRELLVGRLRDCRPETIAALAETARLRTAHRDEAIYGQGEPVLLTLILRGFGKFRRTTVAGHEVASGVGRAGDLFGFSSMASVASSVELVALTDCRVAQWPGPEIRALAREDPGLAIDAVDSMAAALHAMVERVEGYLHQDARLRVLRILARHRDLFFDDPAVLTRADLPSLVGTSREMTGRVLRQLERQGTLERVGQTGLRLLRPDHLEAASSEERRRPT